MNTLNTVMYLYTETPLHAGTGTGLGAVDLPIQREKHTNYPIIQASGVKGALRDTAELSIGRKSDNVSLIFGGASGSDNETHAGAMSPSDARILCFPVRALNGVFVWVSSVPVLQRYQRETRLTVVKDMPDVDGVQVASDRLRFGDKIMLEEFTYQAEVTETAKTWGKHLADRIFGNNTYWRNRMTSHFVILPDKEFRDFVRYSTEIVTRIHIDDDSKTVKDGQLFTQELLPADSLLYSVVRVTDSRDEGHSIKAEDVLSKLQNAVKNQIQIGADETVGRGRMRLKWQEVN